MSIKTPADFDLTQTVNRVRDEAEHAFAFLRDSGTLSASLTFFIHHRVPDTDLHLAIRFPQPWSRSKTPTIKLSNFADEKKSILNEPRLEADTVIHAHTPYLAGWSLAHKSFPILYVAAQRHLLAREIPNHIDRTRSPLDIVRERLDTWPDLAPPPALLESNGGANFWGKGIEHTAKLILFIEEAARYQVIAEQIGGARPYTPGNLEEQWSRTGLLERATSFSRAYAPTES